MRKFTLLTLTLMLAASAQARIVNADEASSIAAKLNTPASEARRVAPAARPVLIHTEMSGAEPLYYVFNRPGGGFVIVSAEDKTQAVLAYSDTQSVADMSALPPAMRAWLDGYAAMILEARANTSASAPRHASRQAVSPLLTTEWGQTAPYNAECPDVIAQGGGTTHAVTGCVAVAMAQVMKYHRIPAEARGDLHYTWNRTDGEPAITMTRNFTGHTYDWDNMHDSYAEDATAAEAALLIADCAYAVEMQFGEKSSGASTELVPFALATYFGYDHSAYYEHRVFHTDAEWEALISDELEARRPVIYTGQTPSGSSHTWVIDGADGNGMYHINWGWEGFQDGYFALTGTAILNPEAGGTGGAATRESYILNQGALIGVRPDAGGQARLNFISLAPETLSHSSLTRPIAPAQAYEDLWFTLQGEFLNSSTRGMDRFCDFGLRVTNVATGRVYDFQMPLTSPMWIESGQYLPNISILKDEFQFLPAGDYDVEAIFRTYTIDMTHPGGIKLEGDGQWKTYRHAFGSPAAQRLTLIGEVPNLYISEALECTNPVIDHLIFKVTLTANTDINGLLVPILYEVAETDDAGNPTRLAAYMDRQNLPQVPISMQAGESRTFWLGEWIYSPVGDTLPKLVLRLALTDSPTSTTATNLEPAIRNQALFTPSPATAIASVATSAVTAPAAIYTVGGQRVEATDVRQLKPGIYVVGGRKIAIR